jgi:hypothetical protein
LQGHIQDYSTSALHFRTNPGDAKTIPLPNGCR